MIKIIIASQHTPIVPAPGHLLQLRECYPSKYLLDVMAITFSQNFIT